VLCVWVGGRLVTCCECPDRLSRRDCFSSEGEDEHAQLPFRFRPAADQEGYRRAGFSGQVPFDTLSRGGWLALELVIVPVSRRIIVDAMRDPNRQPTSLCFLRVSQLQIRGPGGAA
jgi:hypothetical protein